MATSKMLGLRGAAIIVGAGASRGAIFEAPNGTRSPPLDAEFFATAADLFDRKVPSQMKLAKADWNRFKRAVDQAGVPASNLKDWKLETLTTYLEARSNVRFEAGQGKPPKYGEAIRLLKRVVCNTLHFSNGTKRCYLHALLFKEVAPSVVISFNYDLIADQSLLANNSLNWSADTYAHSNTASVVTSSKTYSKRWFPGGRRPSTPGVTLLKLHGSMNWNELKRTKGFQIAGLSNFPPSPSTEFRFASIPDAPFIVPPVAAKIAIPSTSLHDLWREAAKKLRKAKHWIIWGYSFPQTDAITTVLLTTCVKKSRGKQKKITIVNPDHSVESRVKTTLRKVRTTQYNSIEHLLCDHGILQLPNQKDVRPANG